MGIECLDPPDSPALAVILECPVRHGNGLGPAGRPRGHGEHQNSGPRAEKRLDVALPDPVDVWLVAVITADGYLAAKVVRGPDLAEMMVPPELAVGVARDLVKQQLALDGGDVQRLVEEGSGQPAGAVHHRLAEKPFNGLQHGWVMVGKTRLARDRGRGGGDEPG